MVDSAPRPLRTALLWVLELAVATAAGALSGSANSEYRGVVRPATAPCSTPLLMASFGFVS